MQSEFKNIEIRVFRTPDGEGTCCAEGVCCTFLRTTHFGFRDVCAFTEQHIYRKNGDGFTIPTLDCPIWNNKNENSTTD